MHGPLWFVIPCYRRHELTALCLEHLARFTMPALQDHFEAVEAVVISDEIEHLDAAAQWGLYGVSQENMPLGRKWNDGFELAASEGAEYFVPFGSDNWVDWQILTVIPGPREIVARRRSFVVHEHGYKGSEITVSYDGGDGIRTIPRSLLAPVDFRPAAEHARRAIDTSIVERLRRRIGWHKQYVYSERHPFQIVGWQSPEDQLNPYDGIVRGFGGREVINPWVELALYYDRDMLHRMHELFASRRPK